MHLFKFIRAGVLITSIDDIHNTLVNQFSEDHNICRAHFSQDWELSLVKNGKE